MIDTPSTFRGVGDLELFARRWAPASAPTGAVAIVHGFGEHSGRYPAVVAALTAAGFAVHGFDLRGHGRSAGRRGHIDAWSDDRDDVDRYLAHVRAQEAPGTPTFLHGHSLGGAIVLEWGLRRRSGVEGVVASSPALRPRGVRSPVLEWLAAVLSRVWPTFARAGGATDVELHLYEGVYHEAHNDLDAATVEADVVAWLDRHRVTVAD